MKRELRLSHLAISAGAAEPFHPHEFATGEVGVFVKDVVVTGERLEVVLGECHGLGIVLNLGGGEATFVQIEGSGLVCGPSRLVNDFPKCDLEGLGHAGIRERRHVVATEQFANEERTAVGLGLACLGVFEFVRFRDGREFDFELIGAAGGHGYGSLGTVGAELAVHAGGTELLGGHGPIEDADGRRVALATDHVTTDLVEPLLAGRVFVGERILRVVRGLNHGR